MEAACLGENTETTSRVALQDFDLINQSLEALENLVGAISDEVPETQGINKHDVLQKIHLGAMIERLKSTNPIRPEEPIKPNGNECELF